MRFFSKIVFICNCCFLITVVMRLVELRKKASGVTTDALIYQPIQSTLIILGYGAILINLFFFFIMVYKLIFHREAIHPRWMLFFNLVMFPVQIFYFFF